MAWQSPLVHCVNAVTRLTQRPIKKRLPLSHANYTRLRKALAACDGTKHGSHFERVASRHCLQSLPEGEPNNGLNVVTHWLYLNPLDQVHCKLQSNVTELLNASHLSFCIGP